MTNANIILNESIALMEKGILSGTDLKMIVEDAEGNKKEISLPEEIHTFASWKAKGFAVKKGEKAIAKFPIWKHTVKKANAEDEEDETKMFLKMSFFFKASQVQAIN